MVCHSSLAFSLPEEPLVSVQKRDVSHKELTAGDRAVVPPSVLLPRDRSLQAPCPAGDVLARQQCQSHAWSRAMGEVGTDEDMHVPRV